MYESEDDRVNQRRVMAAISDALGWDYVEMPRLHRYDFETTLRHGVVTIEVKCRNRWYGEMFVSADKAIHNHNEALRTGARHLIVFAVGDDIRGHKMRHDLKYQIMVGGRKDRDDPADIEQVLLIPQKLLIPYRQ